MPELLKIWDWFREHIVKAIIIAALSASAVAYLKGIFDDIIGNVLPKGAEISCLGREWVVDHLPFRQPEVAPDVFRILIATLDGDDTSGTLTYAVVRAFQGQQAIDAVSTCRVLRIQGAGLTAEEAAAKIGGKWLAGRKADVLIFGEVLPKGEALNLQFLTSGPLHDFTAKSFRFDSGLLTDEFKEAAAAQLQAAALAAVNPATEQQGEYLVQTLRPVAVRLRRIAESPPPGMSPTGMATVQFSLGQALNAIGDQAGDNQALQKAVEAYGEALKEWTRDRVPLDWALAQNNLGLALERLGERERGTEMLQKAVEAYGEALKEWTRDRVPLQWAAAQNNLGLALARLGERESGTEMLQKAVETYGEALKELPRDRVPLQWAVTQINLGLAFARLGERESGTETLQKAVEAYGEALKELPRDRVPLPWAAAQNNLGLALVELGERGSGTETLQKAVQAYSEALKEYPRDRVPLDWAIVQSNLGLALAGLGERERSTETLRKAVEAGGEALKELKRDRVPLDWAMAQNYLGFALEKLGERESGTETLQKAVEAHGQALKELAEESP